MGNRPVKSFFYWYLEVQAPKDRLLDVMTALNRRLALIVREQTLVRTEDGLIKVWFTSYDGYLGCFQAELHVGYQLRLPGETISIQDRWDDIPVGFEADFEVVGDKRLCRKQSDLARIVTSEQTWDLPRLSAYPLTVDVGTV